MPAQLVVWPVCGKNATRAPTCGLIATEAATRHRLGEASSHTTSNSNFTERISLRLPLEGLCELR